MVLGATTQKKSPLGTRYRRVLMMGDEGVVLYAVEKKKAIRITALPWVAENFDQQLVNALNGGFKGPVVVLFDAVEQHYRKDKLPKVGAMDRSKVLKRKLSLAFPNFTIVSALELKGPKKGGLQLGGGSSAPPEYLFAALPKSENLERIIDILYEAEVSIVGLGLLPVESVGLVEELANRCVSEKGGTRSKWSIIVGHDETGGLRQIVTRNGNLALTRLTPVNETAAETGLAGEIVREFKATLSYITRFGYTSNDGLDVVIIAPKESHNAINLANLPVTNLCTIDLSQAMRMLGGQYTGDAAQTYADSLHALWVAKKPRLTMPMKMKTLDRVSTPRKVASGITILSCMGIVALLWFLYQSYSGYVHANDQIAAKETQKSALTREYEQESEIFEALPVKPEVVNNVLALKKTLEDNSMDVTPLLAALKDPLGNEFLIQTMDLTHEPAEGAPLSEPSQQQRGRGYSPPPKQDQSETGTVTLRLSVYLADDQIELEQKVSRAEALLARLQESLPDHEIEITRQFADISRTGSFSGSAAETETSAPGARADEELAEFTIEGKPL